MRVSLITAAIAHDPAVVGKDILDKLRGKDCHRIFFSLEDIMKQFDLPQLIGIHAKLDSVCTSMRGINMSLEDSDILPWTALLTSIEDYCNIVHFHHASAKAYAIRTELKQFPENFTGITLAIHFQGLKEDLNICMFQHQFVQVEGVVKKYLESVSLFGEAVKKSFPNAAPDIQDAGDSIAVGLNTAAVFHLMHVVEWGLRALAEDVGLSDVAIDRKTDKTVPLAFADWERILNQLTGKIEEKIKAMPRDETKQKGQEFYFSALGEIRGFKEAWRNHVMHTRRSYTREDALAVFSHVQRFMQSLADYGISAC
jgi:hypothetical protein